MDFITVSTLVLVFLIVLMMVLFLLYAFYNERRHMDMQSTFDERVETQHQMYDERLKKREEITASLLERFEKERAQYVLEMLGIYKDIHDEKTYQKTVSINLDEEEKRKTIFEEEEPEEYIR